MILVALLGLTAISLSLNYSLAYSFVGLFIYKLENCSDIGINVSALNSFFLYLCLLNLNM